MEVLQGEVVQTHNTHGTGCTFSAAICALLARGVPLLEAVRRAKVYITGALRQSLSVGKGSGPVGHFWHVTYPPDLHT
jgi:hydroxymethylpyrimidine/phosphomethylpyrimidine kinase